MGCCFSRLTSTNNPIAISIKPEGRSPVSNFSASYPGNWLTTDEPYPPLDGAIGGQSELLSHLRDAPHHPLGQGEGNNPQIPRIGLFDSGLGGLTVLREIYRQLPDESILYFGDTARLPYGNRTPGEIVQFMREILGWMVPQGIKMAIVACNTSSALALETVRSEFNIPILGLILPGARAAVEQGRRIGVIATPATAASNAYRRAIQEIEPATLVWQVGCPEFVPLIEADRISDPYTTEVAREYLAPLLMQQIDTLIYGCTHYPFLEPVIKEILPPEVRLVDPAAHVVAAAVKELEFAGIRETRPPLATRFCVSGSPEEFARRAFTWLGFTPTVEQVELGTAEELPEAKEPAS
ncbi:MAG TPA: glutamate racemase [Oscillatoriaceae cyanobacterium M33_DOE_052]|uniref:Glutamate racemase n=1 Tax=Planktothricoides sp. SpSt-374 TaxID=2282167 RepID=A0A7C3ZZ26_9CYAN|nr:glutamate racemase [Oscillatoriaceae cyanobacterium M33_DOE_052]